MFSTFQAAQEDLRARRAKTRRAEAYIHGTLERGERAQRSLWGFSAAWYGL